MPAQRQKRYNGFRRRQLSTYVESQIEAAVERECARYNVHRSFVIANALAYTFGIDIEEYEKKRVRRGGKK